MSRAKNRVHVTTIDGYELDIGITANMTTTELLQNIAKQLSLEETWFFGLRYTLYDKPGAGSQRNSMNPRAHRGSGPLEIGGVTYEWMRMSKKVLAHKHFKPNPQKNLLQVQLRVRYVPESAEFCVSDPTALRLLYLQARDALLTGEYDVSDGKVAGQFAALSLQFQLGDYKDNYNNRDVNRQVLDEKPLNIKTGQLDDGYMQQTIIQYWKAIEGRDREEIMIMYLSAAEDQIERYGVNYYEIKNARGTMLLLGIDGTGLNIYSKENRSTPKLGFKWSEIGKMSITGTKIELYSPSQLASGVKAQPVELLPRDERIAKQIREQAMGMLNIYKLYHDTIEDARRELEAQIPPEVVQPMTLSTLPEVQLPQELAQNNAYEAYMQPISSQALPEAPFEASPEELAAAAALATQVVVDAQINPQAIEDFMGEFDQMEAAPYEDVPFPDTLFTTTVEESIDADSGGPAEFDLLLPLDNALERAALVALNQEMYPEAAPAYNPAQNDVPDLSPPISHTQKFESLMESPMNESPPVEETVDKGNHGNLYAKNPHAPPRSPEILPAFVPALARPLSEPALNAAFVGDRVNGAQSLPAASASTILWNPDFERRIEQAEERERVANAREKNALDEVTRLREELYTAKETLSRNSEQSSQLQAKLLQIVVAEQEEKKRVQVELETLLFVANEEKFPVSKFLSVRNKFSSVTDKTQWAKLWREEADKPVENRRASTQSVFLGPKRISIQSRRTIQDLEAEMKSKQTLGEAIPEDAEFETDSPVNGNLSDLGAGGRRTSNARISSKVMLNLSRTVNPQADQNGGFMTNGSVTGSIVQKRSPVDQTYANGDLAKQPPSVPQKSPEIKQMAERAKREHLTRMGTQASVDGDIYANNMSAMNSELNASLAIRQMVNGK